MNVGALAFYAVLVVAAVVGILLPSGKLDQRLTDQFNRLSNWRQRRAIMRQKRRAERITKRDIRERESPELKERRLKREHIFQEIRAWIIFLGVWVLLPLACVAIGIWQKQVGNEAWPVIIAVTIICTVRLWAIFISACRSEEGGKCTQ